MEDIKYYLHLYEIMLIKFFHVRMQYRVDTFIGILSMILVSASGLFVYWVVFQSINDIAGIKYYQVMFLYSLYLIVISIVQVLLDNLWNLRIHLMEGTFIKYLIRPINTLFYFLVDGIDIKGFSQLLIGIGCLIYSIIHLELTWTIGQTALLIMFVISGTLILCAFRILAATTAFWISNSVFINIFLAKVIDFAKYPISVFNDFFRIIFTWVMPIGFIAYYPTGVILKIENSFAITIAAPIMAIFFMSIAIKVWKLGVRSFTGVGN